MQTRSGGLLGAVRSSLGRLWNRQTKPDRPGESYLFPIGNAVAGVSIHNPQELLKISAVWRCVNLLSSSIAMLPWNVFKREGDGVGKRQGGHPVEWLLHDQASEEITAFDFKQALIMHSLLSGNGYAEIERDARGTPYALHLLEPDRVTPGRRPDGRLAYEVQNQGGERVILNPRDVFHIHGAAWDGLVGYSVLEVGARSMGACMALDEYLAKFFAQGMRPAGFLKSKGKMSLDALKAAVDVIQERHSGVRKMWKAIPLDNDLEWQQMSANHDDAQFIDLRKFSVLDICRWFGVPPHLAMDLERATFSNIEAQGREFVTYGLMPRIVPMEQEANRKLLTNSRGGLYSKINTNAFLRGDVQARAAYYQTMRNIGVFTINDVLALEDMDTIGAAGDVRVMQSQYVPLEQLGKTQPSAPPAPSSPDPASQPNGRASH